MADKRFVESFLRLNNVHADAPDEEIRKTLLAARWPGAEIEETLALLKGKETPKNTSATEARDLAFRPDMEWSSTKLSSLLGIDVVIDPKSFRASATGEAQVQDTGKRVLVGLCIVVIAASVAFGISLTLMYFFEMGPFQTQAKDII